MHRREEGVLAEHLRKGIKNSVHLADPDVDVRILIK
jgi:hypothetical protein